MSEREQLKQIIDRLPDYKLAYVANLIMGIEKTNIEVIEPDEWDLKMLDEINRNPDCHEFVSQEDLLKELNLTL